MAIILIILISNVIFETSFDKFISEKKVIKGYYGPIFAVTKAFAQEQIQAYASLPNYQQIKIYAYVFSQFPPFHARLGEYFAQINKPDLADLEFKKGDWLILLVSEMNKFLCASAQSNNYPKVQLKVG